MTQCIPIRDLKDTAAISERVHAATGPIIVTKNGYADMVIMSTEVYDRIRTYSIYEKLMEAEADIKQGRTKDAGRTLADIRSRYGL